jgi:FLVCR family MFS transporter
MAAVGKISEDWFPPDQRTTSTAIMAEANLFGGCIVFPIATYAVTTASAQQMLNLDLICAGLSAAAWLGAIVYFPSHPPTPPSASAASQQNSEGKLGFKQLGKAVALLVTDRNFLLLSISYGVCNGMATLFGALLVVDVGTIGMQQTMAGWLGFVASLGGSFGGIILARYSDKKRNQRGALLWMLFLAGICFAVFAIVIQGVFPASFTQGSGGLAVLFVSATLGGLFCDSSVPLFFELSMEITFPMPESTVLMLMTLLNNIATLPPLFVPLDTFGVTWINWAYSAVLLVSTVVLVLFYKNAAPRYDFDASHTVASVLKQAALETEGDEFASVQTTLGELEGQLTLDRSMVRTI